MIKYDANVRLLEKESSMKSDPKVYISNLKFVEVKMKREIEKLVVLLESYTLQRTAKFRFLEHELLTILSIIIERKQLNLFDKWQAKFRHYYGQLQDN